MLDGQVIIDGKQATGKKFISGSESFVLGHYPATPIFPGVLSISLIQAVGEALVGKHSNRKCRTSQISRIQFLDLAKPGDVLEIKAVIKKEEPDSVSLTGTIEVAGKPKMRGNLRIDLL